LHGLHNQVSFIRAMLSYSLVATGVSIVKFIVSSGRLVVFLP